MEGVFGKTAISFLSPHRTEEREGRSAPAPIRRPEGRRRPGMGQEGEGIEGVRFPPLPRARVEQGGRDAEASGGRR